MKLLIKQLRRAHGNSETVEVDLETLNKTKKKSYNNEAGNKIDLKDQWIRTTENNTINSTENDIEKEFESSEISRLAKQFDSLPLELQNSEPQPKIQSEELQEELYPVSNEKEAFSINPALTLHATNIISNDSIPPVNYCNPSIIPPRLPYSQPFNWLTSNGTNADYGNAPELNPFWSAAFLPPWSSFAAAAAAVSAGVENDTVAVNSNFSSPNPPFHYINSLTISGEFYAADTQSVFQSSTSNQQQHLLPPLQQQEQQQQQLATSDCFEGPFEYSILNSQQYSCLNSVPVSAKLSLDVVQQQQKNNDLQQYYRSDLQQQAVNSAVNTLNCNNSLFEESVQFSPVITVAAAAAAAFMSGGNTVGYSNASNNNNNNNNKTFSPMRTQNSRRTGGRRPREIEQQTMNALTDEDKDKKAKRRQRNKEAAARCRQRRLDHMLTLQKQVDCLKDENRQKQNVIEQLMQQKYNLMRLLEHNQCVVPKELNEPSRTPQTSSSHMEYCGQVITQHAQLENSQPKRGNCLLNGIAASSARCGRSVSPNNQTPSYPLCSSVPISNGPLQNMSIIGPRPNPNSTNFMTGHQLQSFNSEESRLVGRRDYAPLHLQASASCSDSSSSASSSASSSSSFRGPNDDVDYDPNMATVMFGGIDVKAEEDDENLQNISKASSDIMIQQYTDSNSMLTDDDPVISEAVYGRQMKKSKLDEDEFGRRPTSLMLSGHTHFDLNNFNTITTPSTGLTTPSMFGGSEYTLLTQRTLLTPMANGPMMVRTPNSPAHNNELRQL